MFRLFRNKNKYNFKKGDVVEFIDGSYNRAKLTIDRSNKKSSFLKFEDYVDHRYSELCNFMQVDNEKIKLKYKNPFKNKKQWLYLLMNS